MIIYKRSSGDGLTNCASYPVTLGAHALCWTCTTSLCTTTNLPYSSPSQNCRMACKTAANTLPNCCGCSRAARSHCDQRRAFPRLQVGSHSLPAQAVRSWHAGQRSAAGAWVWSWLISVPKATAAPSEQLQRVRGGPAGPRIELAVAGSAERHVLLLRWSILSC